jgi:hypothetical protein
MDSKEAIDILKSLLNSQYINPTQRTALETVIINYNQGLSNEQIIKMIEIIVSILFMTKQ